MRRLGIIICDRYADCAGGKCLRALRERVGGFARYADEEVELVGWTTCGGCPGGNVEHAPAEMKSNGADTVHLATGMVVGYPPCPHLETFRSFIPRQFGLEVVVGTHPVPEKYESVHTDLGTWDAWPRDDADLRDLRADRTIRRAYD